MKISEEMKSLEQWPILPGCTYRVGLQALKSARLPVYPPGLGAVLRGSLHLAVTQLFCSASGKNRHIGKQCRNCRCLYRKILRPEMPADHPMQGKYQTPPAPYTIRPFPTTRDYRVGDELYFELLLFGKTANQYLADLIMALQHLALSGLGQTPGSFQLISLNRIPWNTDLPEEPLFPGPLPETPPTHTPNLHFEEDKNCKRITLQFPNLTVIPAKGSSLLAPGFKDLIQRIWERGALLASVYDAYAYPEEPLNLSRAEGIQKIDQQLKVSHWKKRVTDRNGRRPGGRDPIVGFTGEVSFTGEDIPLYLPLIRMGQYLHVGKLTPFGLGYYQVLN